MNALAVYLLTFLIGLVAGLRTFTAPAAVSWAARLGWLDLHGTSLAFFGASATTWIFTIAALFEIVVFDKSPKAASRKSLPQFVGRVLSGALCGAAVGASGQALAAGFVIGAIGAVAGTLGGYEFRSRLARAAGKDLPIAILEDGTAVALAFCLVSRPH